MLNYEAVCHGLIVCDRQSNWCASCCPGQMSTLAFCMIQCSPGTCMCSPVHMHTSEADSDVMQIQCCSCLHAPLESVFSVHPELDLALDICTKWYVRQCISAEQKSTCCCLCLQVCKAYLSMLRKVYGDELVLQPYVMSVDALNAEDTAGT